VQKNDKHYSYCVGQIKDKHVIVTVEGKHKINM